MAKYIIDIPESGHIKMDSEKILCNTENGTVFINCDLDYLTPYTEPDREAIENEVWEFVSRLIWSFVDKEILGMNIALAVRDMTYQEAKEKYEAWRSRFVTINNKKYKIVKEGDGKCILEEI